MLAQQIRLGKSYQYLEEAKRIMTLALSQLFLPSTWGMKRPYVSKKRTSVSKRRRESNSRGKKNLMGKWRWRKYMKTPSCSSQPKTKRWVGLAGAPDLSNLNRLQRLFDTRYSTRFMNRHVKILIRGRAWCNKFMKTCESEKSYSYVLECSHQKFKCTSILRIWKLT